MWVTSQRVVVLDEREYDMKSRWVTRSLLVLALVLLAACGPEFGVKEGAVNWFDLTTPSGEVYSHVSDATTATISAAPTNTDANIREVFWRDTTPWTTNQQVCTTWDDVTDASTEAKVNALTLTDVSQPGLAFRIAKTADGSAYRAITITQNVWAGGLWLFWVDTWDTTPSTDPKHDPFTGVALFDLSSSVGTISSTATTMAPPPWHICARLTGSQLSFMVWTGTNPQPSWDDPVLVHTAQLPAGWDYWGYAGGYVGHLHGGKSMTYSGMSVGAL